MSDFDFDVVTGPSRASGPATPRGGDRAARARPPRRRPRPEPVRPTCPRAARPRPPAAARQR
ncbi:hypothetical protein, partial [Azospirillum brasilense]|uniref:hypothetical protein n=1 Tax=Azospirillum brasilense TaxID=192 RepID=UPI001B3B9EBF